MGLGSAFHIAAQIIGAVAQGILDPAAEYFMWEPGFSKLMRAAVSTIMLVLGILAVKLDPKAATPEGKDMARVDQAAKDAVAAGVDPARVADIRAASTERLEKRIEAETPPKG